MVIQATANPIQPRERQRPGAQGGAATNNLDWMKRGTVARAVLADEAVKAQERAEERAKQRMMPFRFWLPKPTDGIPKQADLILLDAELPPRFFEHDLQDKQTKRFDIYECCPKEWESCPLCEGVAGGKPSYYIMLLSVIDMRPYTNSRTGVTSNFTRKFLPVKAKEQPYFERLADRNGGSLRGIQLLQTRDQNGPQIGMSEFVAQHSEDAIMQSFQHPEVRGAQGQLIKAANADCFAFNFAELFDRPSGEALRRKYGGSAPLGSNGFNGGGNDDGWGGYDPNRTALGASPISRAAGRTPLEDGGYNPPAPLEGEAQGSGEGLPGLSGGGGIQRRAADIGGADMDDDIPF